MIVSIPLATNVENATATAIFEKPDNVLNGFKMYQHFQVSNSSFHIDG